MREADAQPQYGGSTLAQPNIFSYSAAALFQLESRRMPLSCIARKLSECALNVSKLCARDEMKASVVHGENVQPVPIPVYGQQSKSCDSVLKSSWPFRLHRLLYLNPQTL